MTLDDAARARVLFLAERALQGAVDQDRPAAAAAINTINEEHGGEGTAEAIIAWCDTLIAAHALPAGSEFVALNWVDAEGRVRHADVVDPYARWAGRVVMARARMHRDTFSALLDALPDDGMAVSEHLAVLLELIAVNLRAVKSGEPPQSHKGGSDG
jgi:hypothetical protein